MNETGESPRLTFVEQDNKKGKKNKKNTRHSATVAHKSPRLTDFDIKKVTVLEHTIYWY